VAAYVDGGERAWAGAGMGACMQSRNILEGGAKTAHVVSHRPAGPPAEKQGLPLQDGWNVAWGGSLVHGPPCLVP
jgi:hypothetical protein